MTATLSFYVRLFKRLNKPLPALPWADCIIAIILIIIGLFCQNTWQLWLSIGMAACLLHGYPLLKRYKYNQLRNKYFGPSLTIFTHLVQSGLPLIQSLTKTRHRSHPVMTPFFKDLIMALETNQLDTQTIEQRYPLQGIAHLMILIKIHVKTGIPLGPSLQDLSRLRQQHIKLARKSKAMTAGSRLSAFIMSLLPLIVIGVLTLCDLRQSIQFNTLTFVAMGLWFIGVAWTLYMLYGQKS
jgi:Flp pilus assembly protein TadB